MRITENSRNSGSGFTLIELLIVVAVIAILSAIALPLYSDYVVRSKLPDAFSSLSAARVKMEQFHQDYHTYLDGGACPGKVLSDANSKYFTLKFADKSCSDSAFVIQADGNAGANLSGFSYSIDQNDERKTASLPAAWGNSPYNCANGKPGWISRKDRSCQ